MTTAWRIVKSRFIESAFAGDGARIHGGRWNSPGVPVVYTAENASLAILEVLVHEKNAANMDSWSLISVRLPTPHIRRIPLSKLPPEWKSPSSRDVLKSIGEEWIENMDSVALRVPTVITPGEFNYLINPDHPAFADLTFGNPVPIEFDPR